LASLIGRYDDVCKADDRWDSDGIGPAGVSAASATESFDSVNVASLPEMKLIALWRRLRCDVHGEAWCSELRAASRRVKDVVSFSRIYEQLECPIAKSQTIIRVGRASTIRGVLPASRRFSGFTGRLGLLGACHTE